MKTKFHSLAMVIVTFLVVFTSCSKEDSISPVDPVVSRQPVAPLARAGNDTIMYPPFNSYVLDGSASADPDNNIISYAWKFLSGPSALEVNSYVSVVKGLDKIGDYKFELTVTDADQLFSKDTVIVTIAEPKCTTRSGEHIFKDLPWNYAWIMEIDIHEFYSYLPANSHILNIYIKRDSSKEWETVVQHSSDYSMHTWGYGDGVLVIFPNRNLENDTPDVKIEYCK